MRVDAFVLVPLFFGLAGPAGLEGDGLAGQEPEAVELPEGFSPVAPASSPAAVEARVDADRAWEKAFYLQVPREADFAIRVVPTCDGAKTGWLSGSGGTLTLAARESDLEGGVSRFGHEQYGLPAHRVRGDWVEVTLGFTASGDARRGWIRIPEDDPHAAVLARRDMLRHCGGGYLAEPPEVELYREPGGDPIVLPSDHPALTRAPDDPFDRRLEVLELHDGWVHVRDYESREFWLELKDERGRFQLDYDRGHCSPPLPSATG